MKKNGHEKKKGGYDSHQYISLSRNIRIIIGKVASGEAPHNKKKDDKPTQVKFYGYTKDPCQADTFTKHSFLP